MKLFRRTTENNNVIHPWLQGVFVVILLASLSLNGYYYFFSTYSGFGQSAHNSLLNPARGIIDKKDLIINVQPLRDRLNEIGNDPNISIYFEYMNTGANIAVNKDTDFFPASLLKLPVAISAVKKIESGQWKWSNELVLMDTDKDEAFGDLYKQPVGSLFTIEELIKKSLVESDNTAHFILLRNLDPKEYEETQRQLGLDDFISKDGKISAKKYAVILRQLYNAAYLSPDNSERLIEFMTESPFNEFLAAGLGKDKVRFSHKIGIGSKDNVYLDAGIVYLPNRPYILIFMMNSPDVEKAKMTAQKVSREAYEYVKNYKVE